MKTSKVQRIKEKKGITLIALIVTLVVLIILATVSINAVLGDNGIIKKAQKAKQMHENSMQTEQEMMNTLLDEYENMMAEPPISEIPKGPNGKPLINKETVAMTNHGKIVGEDTLGNQVVVPKGFKIANDSGTTVKEGIVIEDSEGNQFVWIPVSNINGDGTGKIKVNSKDEAGVEITLGRYTFKREQNSETELYEDGTPTLVQKGVDYAATTITSVDTGTVTQYKIEPYYYELADSRTSSSTGTNTTAKNLEGFIKSVKDHHGYYLARYEASYGSDYEASSEKPYADAKPLSQKSDSYSVDAMNYTKGTLWNFITQANASTVCQNMYKKNSKVEVESDLCNSYAWDTAIVYIQAMGHHNYANQMDGNGTLKNTGETGDKKCNLFDIAGNCFEFTTEYSTSSTTPCTNRGRIL